MTTQSQKLSEKITTLYSEGRTLIDDSSQSEGILKMAITQTVLPYATQKISAIGGTIRHVPRMTLYEQQEYFQKVGGPAPNPENKRVYMQPDGGIIIATIDGQDYPILIPEDKVQGTNDHLFTQGKKKQSTGNAIERGAKNIRGAEMIFASRTTFPYVIFASGCDFHHSETISKRLEMMNHGVPNRYIEITPESTPEQTEIELQALISSINVRKINGFFSNATIFVKAHKFDQMPNGSSRWNMEQISNICCRIIDQVVDELTVTLAK